MIAYRQPNKIFIVSQCPNNFFTILRSFYNLGFLIRELGMKLVVDCHRGAWIMVAF